MRQPTLGDRFREFLHVDTDALRVELQVLRALDNLLVPEVSPKRVERVGQVPPGAIFLDVGPQDRNESVSADDRPRPRQKSEQRETPRLTGGAWNRLAIARDREGTEGLDAEQVGIRRVGRPREDTAPQAGGAT